MNKLLVRHTHTNYAHRQLHYFAWTQTAMRKVLARHHLLREILNG